MFRRYPPSDRIWDGPGCAALFCGAERLVSGEELRPDEQTVFELIRG